MQSPTQKNQIRKIDSQGSGRFAAPRGIRLHNGEDYVAKAGSSIFAPHAGMVTRIVQVYPDSTEFKGIEILGKNIISHVYYVFPVPDIIGMVKKAGDLIGYAQDITKRYPGIINHIHWQIYIKPSILLTLSEG